MGLEIVNTISSLIAAVSVVVTVIYLAIQVRRNTKAAHSQTYQVATLSLAEMAVIIGQSKDLSRIFAEGMANPDQLDKDERYQFIYLGLSLFRRYENVFFQYQAGLIDDGFWSGHRENLVWFFHQPGFKQFWAERRLGFSRGFCEFLENTTADSLESINSRNL